MPATTERQRRYMGAELARLRAGQPTQTGMSERQLEHYAAKPVERLGDAAAKHMRRLGAEK